MTSSSKNSSLKWIVIMLAPALLIYTAVVWFPTGLGFFESLYKWRGAGGNRSFVGLRNYTSLFSDKGFLNSIWITLKYLIINVPVQIFLSYILAYLLFICGRGQKLFRFLFFVPVVMLTVAVGISFSYLFSSVFGVLKPIAEFFGFEYFDPLAREETALMATMVVDWWKFLGIKIMLFYAGFQNIPMELVEAAHIDGASRIKIFFNIIVPLSVRNIAMVTTLLVIGSLKVFDLLYVMTSGGPNRATQVISVFLIDTTFGEQNFGKGSAIAVIMFVLSLIITLILRKGMGKLEKKYT